jgi:hypothetical protein
VRHTHRQTQSMRSIVPARATQTYNLVMRRTIALATIRHTQPRHFVASAIPAMLTTTAARHVRRRRTNHASNGKACKFILAGTPIEGGSIVFVCGPHMAGTSGSAGICIGMRVQATHRVIDEKNEGRHVATCHACLELVQLRRRQNTLGATTMMGRR